MASLLLAFKPLGLSLFPSRKQNFCPTLAASSMTYTSQPDLDPLTMGSMESTLGPFLNDGDLAWTQALLAVIMKGGWTLGATHLMKGFKTSPLPFLPPTARSATEFCSLLPLL